MFTEWCRKKFGGVRLALTVYSIILSSIVVVGELILKGCLSGGGYTLLGGIVVQVIASNWAETKRPTGGKKNVVEDL